MTGSGWGDDNDNGDSNVRDTMRTVNVMTLLLLFQLQKAWTAF